MLIWTARLYNDLKIPFLMSSRAGFHYTYFVLSLDLEKYTTTFQQVIYSFFPVPCLEILMVPQTVPFVTNFPLLPQPAPVGPPLPALRLGQAVRHVNVVSLGILLLTFISLLFCTFASMPFGINLVLFILHDTESLISIWEYPGSILKCLYYHLLKHCFSTFRIVFCYFYYIHLRTSHSVLLDFFFLFPSVSETAINSSWFKVNVCSILPVAFLSIRLHLFSNSDLQTHFEIWMVLDRDDRKMPKDSGRENGQTWRADRGILQK